MEDYQAAAEDCTGIRFNIYHEAFETVRDYCHLFLSNSIAYSYKRELKLFAFLLPMDYLFEDFLHGFIKKEVDGVGIKYQSTEKRLDIDRHYTLSPDMVLTCGDRIIIADAKYKLINLNSSDPYKSISQGDLYQMLAYAVRYKCYQVILLYPQTLNETVKQELDIRIKDFADKIITIRVCQVPIINRALCSSSEHWNHRLEDLFLETKKSLSNKLGEIIRGSCEENTRAHRQRS